MESSQFQRIYEQPFDTIAIYSEQKILYRAAFQLLPFWDIFFHQYFGFDTITSTLQLWQQILDLLP